MRIRVTQWIASYRVILVNAVMLMGTSVFNAVLGFAYWWLAARQFPPSTVGIASAGISATMLLATVGALGIGTLLIGELPRQPRRAAALITTALLVAGIAGATLGILFAALAPSVVADLRPLISSIPNIALFAFGASVATITLVIDQALIGLFRGGLQLWRNFLFASVKLAALVWVAQTIVGDASMAFVATWAVGGAVSLAALIVHAGKPTALWRNCRPDWGLLRELGNAALGHHVLNVSIQVTGLALPLVVTAILSATANAYFYTAAMIASFIFVMPTALATMLFAVSAEDPRSLARKLRFTLGLAFALGLLANAALEIGAYPLMSLFGADYADNAAWPLRLFGLGVFSLILREHYVALSRIQRRTVRAAKIVAACDLPKLAMAALGAAVGGLVGLAIGSLLAACLETLILGPAVLRAAAGPAATRLLVRRKPL